MYQTLFIKNQYSLGKRALQKSWLLCFLLCLGLPFHAASSQEAVMVDEAGNPVAGSQHPPHYKDVEITQKGRISEISLTEGMLYLSGLKYRISLPVPVFLLESSYASLQQLQPGMVVGIKHVERNGELFVLAIWELDEKSVPPS